MRFYAAESKRPFEDDPRIGQLLDHLDCIPAAEMERQWPQMLVALMDVLEKELGRQTVPGDNRQQARKLVAALAHYMGPFVLSAQRRPSDECPA